MSNPAPSPPTATTRSSKRKPRLSLAIATACGLGYVPKAPGTFGALAGVILSVSPRWIVPALSSLHVEGTGVGSWNVGPVAVDPFVLVQWIMTIGVAVIGLWCADRAAKYWHAKDPQRVVIDEVSGQQLALLLGGFWGRHASFLRDPLERLQPSQPVLGSHPLGMSMLFALNWKYLLLGFILFRVFDIWKPFPARQAESLHGGLGIMADDWIAGVYAALGLWIARAIGL
jgi:phosphatidylglycerophosphatase A